MNKSCMSIIQPVTEEYIIKFECNDKEFLENFSKLLQEFYTKYDGQILFEKSEISKQNHHTGECYKFFKDNSL